MQKAIKRLIDKAYPELSGQYHLPRFAEVVSVRETPQTGSVADPFRPYYAVDVQVLNEHGEPDKAFPVLYDVPLPTNGAGHEQGQFAFPQDGTRVELAFAYGSPNQPFIRSIQPHNLSLPQIERGEQRWQHGASSYQRCDKDGGWETKTDTNITEDSLKRIISALENLETYTKSVLSIEADSTETVGGTKKVDAMGALRHQSGGRAELIALHDITATSSTKQIHKAPKTWVGSETENVLMILSELMAQVISLCNTLASHTHSGVQAGAANTAAPVQASNINTIGSNTSGIKGRLDGIKE